MPDDKGDLLPEERAEFSTWLNEKTKPQPCVFCGKNAWVVGDSAVNLFLYYGDAGLQFGGPTIPAFLVYCANCGHIEFFSPVVMKLVKPSAPESTADSVEEVDVGH